MKKFLILLLCLFAIDSFASGIASNSASAPCTNTTLETYSGNSNLSADWQPNTINLSWYNEDEKLTVQQSAQSCVYDGGLTIPSTQPTRTGYTFAGWTIRIPGTYTELEYLESTGTQYIDTGIVATRDFKWELDNQFISIGTYGQGGSYNGVYDEHSSPVWRVDIAILNSNNGTLVMDFVHYNGITYPNGYIYTNRYLYTIDAVNKKWKVGSIEGSFPAFSTQNTANKTIYLFAQNDGDHFGTDRYSIQKTYSSKMYSGNTLIQNLVPVRRNSDGVLGMYDTVTQTFFTNQGTGTFVAGPDVQ